VVSAPRSDGFYQLCLNKDGGKKRYRQGQYATKFGVITTCDKTFHAKDAKKKSKACKEDGEICHNKARFSFFRKEL
jgi:hypothetical protein